MRMISDRRFRLALAVVVLLALWTTRLWALELLPLHNDEGLHLTRAVEVWNGHPFWVISDGKIINHWLIAAFYPQNAPVFAARVATGFISLIGLAAVWQLARLIGRLPGSLLAAGLWIGSPYLFFYERLAFSDAEAGALTVLAVLAAMQFTRTRRYRDAVFAGLAFGLAALFKFTAAPFALAVVLVMLLAGQVSPRGRMIGLTLAGAMTAACFAVPLGYLVLKEKDLFTIALGWIGISSGSASSLAFAANLERLWAQLLGFGAPIWVILVFFGLVSMGLLSVSRAVLPHGRRLMVTLLLAGLLPLLLIMALGREVLSRHYVVTLPLLLTLGGGGLGTVIVSIRRRSSQVLIMMAGLLALATGFLPVFQIAISDPADLPLPADAHYEHITSHSSGYGLREAVQAFPATISRRDLPLIGSMFPDSCRRANFYAVNDLKMTCTDAPGLPLIEAALAERGAAYVLVDNAPLIGLDVSAVEAKAERLAGYPRPGESEEAASVVLWYLETHVSQGAAYSPGYADCRSKLAVESLCDRFG